MVESKDKNMESVELSGMPTNYARTTPDVGRESSGQPLEMECLDDGPQGADGSQLELPGNGPIPIHRNSKFYRSMRRKPIKSVSNKEQGHSDRAECKDDNHVAPSNAKSLKSPIWRHPLVTSPLPSSDLPQISLGFKARPQLRENRSSLHCTVTECLPSQSKDMKLFLEENRLSHSQVGCSKSKLSVPSFTTRNVQQSPSNLPEEITRPAEDISDIDNISLSLLDATTLTKRENEEQPTEGPAIRSPPEAWRTLIEQIGLLYQEYRDKSKLQEIELRRQFDVTNSPTSGEYMVHEVAAKTLSASKTQTIIPTMNGSLWQNQVSVRTSGALSMLSPEEIKLQEAMFELLTSEASYYKSVELLVTHFMENKDLKKCLSQSDMHFMFSNILDVMKVSERFLLDLEQRFEENFIISDVCDIVYHHAFTYFHEFVNYVSNQTYQDRAYRRICEENTTFKDVIAQLERDSKCKGLPFTSFLILPFQRIIKLKLLVQIVKNCNEGVRKMNRTEELIAIEKTLEFKFKSVPIISHSRWLVKRGELLQMMGPKSNRTLHSKKLFQPLYFFLFNNLLLVTKRSSSGDKYQVVDTASKAMLRTEDMETEGITLKNIFCLRLLENQEEREVTYMLKASCQSRKIRWMSALSPNPRTKFISSSSLTNSPQVQCVHPYVAQEEDELSLELADVLCLLEETEDGWMFAERFHDRERGWFPGKVVEVIQNQQLRAQNLRECQRLHPPNPGKVKVLTSRGRFTKTAPH
ncbi:ephexin-1 isoform X2 [Polypterus senegalus]|uniref:ephexin-1 isoform X2 n=1 Tax=Polypterus senegalus TaxID=55291 RepID=UPI001965AC0E|nr:ephexin-1 isoform X2 [Polypterus senegalus]